MTSEEWRLLEFILTCFGVLCFVYIGMALMMRKPISWARLGTQITLYLAVMFAFFVFGAWGVGLFALIVAAVGSGEYRQSAQWTGGRLLVLLALLVPLAFLFVLYDLGGAPFLIYAVVILNFADSAAFVVGTHLGSHLIAPSISPRKTYEGLLGSFLLVLLVSALFFQRFHPVGFGTLIAASAVLTVVGFTSDLFFSSIKRRLDIADFGRILPGHGGVLDRFDSLVFVAPALATLFVTLGIAGAST